MHLTVREPFFNYVRGDVITDQIEIAKVLTTHPHHIIEHYPHPDTFFKSDAEIAAGPQPKERFAGIKPE